VPRVVTIMGEFSSFSFSDRPLQEGKGGRMKVEKSALRLEEEGRSRVQPMES
jgi:hypothetical protein